MTFKKHDFRVRFFQVGSMYLPVPDQLSRNQSQVFLKKVYCKYSQKKRTCDYVVMEIQKIVMKLLKQLTLHLNICWETRKTITFGEIACDDLDVTSTSYLIKIGPLST